MPRFKQAEVQNHKLSEHLTMGGGASLWGGAPHYGGGHLTRGGVHLTRGGGAHISASEGCAHNPAFLFALICKTFRNWVRPRPGP